jgi:uncharacterized membrane protein
VDDNKDLGKPVSVYGMSPAHLQRAVFIVILSFLFFMIMMFAYYVRQSLVYFLLASAFLVLYLITMISWAMHRRTVVTVHEHGLSYKGRTVHWSDIKRIDNNGAIEVSNASPMVLPKMLHRADELIATIRQRSGDHDGT